MSFVPALRGGSLRREALFWHFPHDTPASGQHPATTVRRGDWKLHRIFAGNDDGTDLLELYNLRDDLGETNNLAAAHPALVRELNALIGGFLRETAAVIPTRNPGYQPGAATPAAPRKAPKKKS
jgi:arylsulfatase A-like enzyme